jgi:hypothetical protein
MRRLMHATAILLAIALGPDSSFAEGQCNLMAGEQQGRARIYSDRVGIRRFAWWFHQDFSVVFPDFCEGIQTYLSSLSESERSLLLVELREFVRHYEHADEEYVRQAWFNLGAQMWPRNRKVVPVLLEVSRALDRGDG